MLIVKMTPREPGVGRVHFGRKDTLVCAPMRSYSGARGMWVMRFWVLTESIEKRGISGWWVITLPDFVRERLAPGPRKTVHPRGRDLCGKATSEGFAKTGKTSRGCMYHLLCSYSLFNHDVMIIISTMIIVIVIVFMIIMINNTNSNSNIDCTPDSRRKNLGMRALDPCQGPGISRAEIPGGPDALIGLFALCMFFCGPDSPLRESVVDLRPRAPSQAGPSGAARPKGGDRPRPRRPAVRRAAAGLRARVPACRPGGRAGGRRPRGPRGSRRHLPNFTPDCGSRISTCPGSTSGSSCSL